MTECNVSQEHIVRVYSWRMLSYAESMMEDILTDLNEAGLSAEMSMVNRALDAVQDALAFFEDPGVFVADNMPESDDDISDVDGDDDGDDSDGCRRVDDSLSDVR